MTPPEATLTPAQPAPNPGADDATRRRRATERSLTVALKLLRSGPVLILLLFIAVMALLSDVFLTGRNMQNLLVQSAVVAALGIGQLAVILTRGIDLSVGSLLALSAVVGGVVFTAGEGGALVIATMLGVGLAAGVVNGTTLVKGRLPHPFIVTLAMLSIARGLALVISGGTPTDGISPAVVTLGSGFVGWIPIPAIVVASLAALAYVVLRHTQWGRWIYVVGGNPEAARRSGIPVGRILISVYAISGLTAGIAGVLTAGRTASAFPTAGNLAELDAITAVIVGGASFSGGRGNVLNVLVGALTIGVIRNGMNLIGVDPFWQQCVIGLVILGAVYLDVLRGRLESRFRVMHSQEAA
ncbi:MAG TPA: ABC transporter permease [Conexibacter sp.]